MNVVKNYILERLKNSYPLGLTLKEVIFSGKKIKYIDYREWVSACSSMVADKDIILRPNDRYYFIK